MKTQPPARGTGGSMLLWLSCELTEFARAGIECDESGAASGRCPNGSNPFRRSNMLLKGRGPGRMSGDGDAMLSRKLASFACDELC